MSARRWAPGLLLVLLALVALGGLAEAEVVQKGDIRVKFEGELTPKALPRTGVAPVRVTVGAKITALKASDPPRLRRISIAINSAGKFNPNALPVCTIRDIQPSTTQNALKACGPSLVGTGRFAAKILLPQQASFPAGGKLYAFNGVLGCSPGEQSQSSSSSNDRKLSGRGWPSRSRTQGGRQGERTPVRNPQSADRGRRDATCHPRPAILAHVYGTKPVPTSFTLPFVLTTRKGELGTVLTASLAEATGKAGYITELSLDLDGSKGSRRTPYLSAACPARKGFGSANFSFARATFDFGRSTLDSTLTRNCQVRG